MRTTPLRRRLLLALAVLACGSCRRGPSDREAVEVVRRYLRGATEAYRTGDVRGLPAVAGPAEVKKVAAIVGVKGDMGVTMDAELVDLHVERVDASAAGADVLTRERWRWRDLRIGTGEQVGESSSDRYHLRYRLAPADQGWVVSGVDFLDPPEATRKEPARAPPSTFH
jgi:hypothetical protein